MAKRMILMLALLVLLCSSLGCASGNWQYTRPDPAKFDGYDWYAAPGLGSATVEPSTSH